IGLDQVRDLELAYQSLLHAFSVGYRSVDTASSYANEEAVGRAVRDCGLRREELYITTKLTAADQGYEPTLHAFDQSLARLGLDYIDCFMVHWPGKYLYVETWRAFLRLYEEKRVRVIGVCNFNPHHLEKLKAETGVLPMVDQFESHPYFPQNDLTAFCKSRGILTEAWSPLMCGGLVLKDPAVAAVAAACGKSPAQVILRWHHQKGHRVFPKSTTPKRIEENVQIFDFALSEDQMSLIDALAKQQMRIGPNPDIFFEL
ncbi:MAG: aldo/keto reductase, partial [Oscillospiraceae bacterium]